MDHDELMARVEELKAGGQTPPRQGRDPVNQPMVNHWTDAIGDANPIYRDTPEAHEINGGPVAPTAMAQVWTMPGLSQEGRAGMPLYDAMALLDETGYTSVLGTDCDQTYERYLRPGEEVTIRSSLESVVGPKQTGVGEGYFVTTHNVWCVGEEQVATMTFRVLKFKPPARPVGSRVQPLVNRDSEYFWEGTELGEVRIQRCEACGVLRHPPGPMCPACHETKRSYVVASGRGTVHSYVVHHAPQIPGRQLPLRLGLVELEEGVRMVGVLTDEAEIGDAVLAGFERSGDVTLVTWGRA